MRITHKLRLEQTQKLIMTQELQQAITLLQLPVMELQAFILAEYLNNPVLDLEEPEEERNEENEEQPPAELERDPIDWDEYLRDQGYEPLPKPTVSAADTSLPIDYAVSTELSLQDHLLRQLGLCRLQPIEKRIGEFLIGNIDSNGYLKGEPSELAELLGVETEEIMAVLAVIQSFDPTGVAARDLKECLLLQLRERQNAHPLAETIISNYLPEVADNKIKKIAAELEVEAEAVQAAIDCIRTLDPKPGRAIGGDLDVRYVVPDVVVEKVDDEYIIMVNELNMPRLTINSYYRSLLAQGKTGQVASEYIKSRLDSALWLVRSLEQRRQTLYRVTEAIVKMQLKFFERGIKYLKPMTLKQIAEQIDVHESTVSRATVDKYVQTPRGLYPFKFFFSSGVETQQGKTVSAEAIKSYIKELIAAEDVYKPYSDEKLRLLLSERGIDVSRRTIAKYRDELNIPASSKRRRH